jgi:cyclopropane fatty-acyl-phospholipid synthase-like methyltransferase
MYDEAKRVFIALCKNQGLDFSNIRMLDIGCGTGFYAQIFRENGGRNYVGIDIADTLFGKLREMYPDYEFCKKDVGMQELEGKFDLIIMIDVTQHITDDVKFSYAMQNVKSHLTKDGTFIVTSWLNDKLRTSCYEVSRSMEAYNRQFPDFVFGKPVPFRDKYIFSIKKKT